MQKKLYFGLFLAAIVGIVAGARYLNRPLGAQDAPKQVVPAPQKEPARSASTTLPALPPRDVVIKASEVREVPNFPTLESRPEPIGEKELPPPIAIPSASTEAPRPLRIPDDVEPLKPLLAQKKDDAPMPLPLPPIVTTSAVEPVLPQDDQTKKSDPLVVIPPTEFVKPAPPAPPIGVAPLPPPGVSIPPIITGSSSQPQVEPVKKPEAPEFPLPAQAKDPALKPAIGSDEAGLKKPLVEPVPPPRVIEDSPIKPPVHNLPTVPVAPYVQPEALKNSPWSLHVEVVDGQTILTATVSKKHAFKIVCQNLHVQTAQGLLKATGKVQITGESLNGTCEHLGIPLGEDRLVLEGRAEVRIEKSNTLAQNGSPTTFELKGETLNLRVSDIHSGKLVQTGWIRTQTNHRSPDVREVLPTARTANETKQWTPYGKLQRVMMKLYPGNETALWELHGPNGQVLATLIARDGGTLAQFEGQTISVLGTTEQIAGQNYLRVTHVAMP